MSDTENQLIDMDTSEDVVEPPRITRSPDCDTNKRKVRCAYDSKFENKEAQFQDQGVGSTGQQKSAFMRDAKQYRVDFGFGSSPRESRQVCETHMGQEVTVVATLVADEEGDGNSDKLLKKTIYLQKVLISLCLILIFVAIGVAIYQVKQNNEDSAIIITPGSIEEATSVPSHISSDMPSHKPSRMELISPEPSNSNTQSFPIFDSHYTWAFTAQADIGVGPGSYYSSNPNITVQNSHISTELEAYAYVQSFNLANPQNPIIMWMISPPESRFLGLVGHRLLFLSQNLDASTGKDASAFVQDTADWLQIVGKEGKNVYHHYESPWRMKEFGDIGIGVGSVYQDDFSVTVLRAEITTEKEGYAFTELFNAEHGDNPIIMWEISWTSGSYRAHRQKFVTENQEFYTTAEEFIDAGIDFMRQTNREEHKSNTVFYSKAE